MDFSYNDDQRMLDELVNKFISQDYDFSARKVATEDVKGFSDSHWDTIADMGLLGINVCSESGGFGGGAIEAYIVMEAFGRGLVVEPYVANAIMVAQLIDKVGTDDQKEKYLQQIIAGNHISTIATYEPDARYDLAHIALTAEAYEGGYRLNGCKTTVLHGDAADSFVVSCRASGAVDDKSGILLALVDTKTSGVSIKFSPTFDNQHVAEVTFDNVLVPKEAVLGSLDNGWSLLEYTVDCGIAAVCAEAAGAMQKLLDLCSEYLQTRVQFGKPLSSFQALQHRLADILIAVEQCRSMALYAAAQLEEQNPQLRRRALSAAKSLVGLCGRQVGESATQLHGGMGMTDEGLSGHYFKRLIAIDKTWGDSSYHAEIFEALL